MTGGRVRAAVLAATCAIAVASAAHADPAEADALFRDGRALATEGRLAEACERFEASGRLDPSVGALLNLGDCREQLGELAAARDAFRDAAALAASQPGDDAREAEARRRAELLERRLTAGVDPLAIPVRPVEVEASSDRVAAPHEPLTPTRRAALGFVAFGAAAAAGGLISGLEGERRALPLLAVGGVAAAIAAVLWHRGAPRAASPRVSVTPAVDPDRRQVAVAVAGRF
jgi:tetratricopeptide (TPR) repeat protein